MTTLLLRTLVLKISSPYLLASLINHLQGASLVGQWIRMQGTQVRSLIWEDSTCRGATKPVCHNYGARVPEPTSRDR